MGGFYLLASYPKSGNTWMRLALSSLEKGGVPIALGYGDKPWWEMDWDARVAGILSNRFFFDEYNGVESSELTAAEIDALRGHAVRALAAGGAAEGCRPPVIKIHDAFRRADGTALLPRDVVRGVVCIVRDPRDVAGSFADHMGLSLPEAVKAMADADFTLARQGDKAAVQLPQRLSSWSGHVTGWLESGLPLLLVRYEDMIADMARELGRVADFVDLPAARDAIARAVDATCFDRLRKAEDENGFRERSAHSKHFFRQGKAGAWHTNLPEALARQIEQDHGAVMRRFGYLPEGA